MANINVSEPNPAGSKLFKDSEGFLQDLADTDAMAVQGGEGGAFLPYIAYGQKFLEYGVNGFAINNIASIAKSFSAVGIGGGAGGVGGGAGGAGGGAGGGTGGAGGGAGGAGGAGGGAGGAGGGAGGGAATVGSVPGLSGSITYTL